jgi:hypothetical protein
MKRILLACLLLIGLHQNVWASVAHVQCATGTWSSGTTYTTSITATNGNLLAVAAQILGSSSTDLVSSGVGAITDGTNTYTLLDTIDDTGGGTRHARLATYYAKNITGGSLTVTTTLSGSGVTISKTFVCEVSGADTSSPLDQHTMAEQYPVTTSTDNLTSGSVTTTANGEYVFGAGCQGTLNTATPAAGTGFTSGASSSNCRVEYQIQSSSGSIAATFTPGESTDGYFAAVATFKAASGGGTTPHFLSLMGVGK